MPNIFSVHINPDCLDFLKQVYPHKLLSERQKIFRDNLNDLNQILCTLRNQPLFQFSAAHQKEISRGAFYAFTPSLKKLYLEQQEINLAILQTTLKEEFQIPDKHVVDFIIMCLIEPVYLPFALYILVNSLLVATDYYCSNDSSKSDIDFKYILKAEPTITHGQILFNLSLPIKNIHDPSPVGNAYIPFIITEKKQIKFEPIEITFCFTDNQEAEAKQFKQELIKEFKNWVLSQDELDNIKLKYQMRRPMLDFCIIPILIGFLFGLIAMISMLCLGFTVFSPLLLPAAGLGLGLMLASLTSSCAWFDRKKDKDKLQRPIHLFNKPDVYARHQTRQATSFFNHPALLNSTHIAETRFVLNR